MIPKIIHYCWLSNDPIPPDIKKYMETWRTLLPEYEFIKWDFTRFPKHKSDWVKEAFNDKKYAFAADLIRIYAVYNYGGIYMDMDIEVKRPFGDLLNSKYMFGYERTEGKGFEAGCFGAEKGNEFLKECLKYYKDRHFIVDGVRDTVTLPQIMQKIYNDNHFKYNLLPNEYLTAKSYDTGEINVTSNTRTIHHFVGSWIPDKTKKYLTKIQSIQAKHDNKIVIALLTLPHRAILAIDKRGVYGALKHLLSKRFKG